MLTTADVRALDLNSAWHGVLPSSLMQNAGQRLAQYVLEKLRPKNVHVLAGWGNNGGDGVVAARHLSEAGAAVVMTYARSPDQLSTPEARLAFENLPNASVKVETFSTQAALQKRLARADVIIDALLGVGVSGELREPIRSMVKAANASRKPIVSIDVPTGLGTRLRVRPATTVTLHDRKKGMTSATCGSIRVVDIGIPRPAEEEVGPGDLAAYFPRNPSESHKGQNGRVLIVAGGPYSGAPLLSSLAALRSGADLVHLFTAGEAAEAARAHSPDLIVHEGAHDDRIVPDDAARIEKLLPKVDAVLMGPGLGPHRETRTTVKEILAGTQKRKTALVLDADALAVAGEHANLLRRRPVIVTPHAAEYHELTGRKVPGQENQRKAAIARSAKRLGVAILLKGATDVISDGRMTKTNRVHHPWMTAGGTGDVLAGVCTAFLSKKMPPVRAACAAAFLNGAAGVRAFKEKSWGSRATDLISEIPHVLREWT